MDNRVPNMRQDAVTQASEFFIEFRAGDGTPAVRARFEKWLRSSPENVQAYLEIAAGWAELPTADPEERIDIEALMAKARSAQAENVVYLSSGQVDLARRFRAPRIRLWAFAGSVAILLVALAGARFWITTQGAPTYNTGIGEQRTLILADGSTVTLDALTTVRVRMTRDAREVILVRGQAYFHDTDEPARPFVVQAGKNSVRAIGTEFDVDEVSDRTVVTVLAGQVAVAKSFPWINSIGRRELLQELARPVDGPKAVLVTAGQQVTVLAQYIPPPSPVDVAAATAWREQRLIFDGTPLWRVAEQFNLYSKKRLVIADRSLQSVAVSGEYSASDPAALIGFLRSQPTMHVAETDDSFVVAKP